MKFQELCADLMAEAELYKDPLVYGRNGQAQRGIDILAPLSEKTGLHVAQCKAWEEASAAKVREATKNFIPHVRYWHALGVKRFILLVGCPVDDIKAQDQVLRETLRFKRCGLEYECWDARVIRRKLVPYPHIVRNHCEPAEYWADFICGKEANASMDPTAQVGLNAIIARHGQLILELSDAKDSELTQILSLWEEGKSQEAFASINVFCCARSWQELSTEVRAKSLRIQASITLAVNGDVANARRLLEQARGLVPNACMALEASITRIEQNVFAALALLISPENLNAWNIRLCLLLEAGKPEEVISNLAKLPAEGAKHPTTAWAKGMALLCLKRVEEAHDVFLAALVNHSRSLQLRMGISIVRYASGISRAFAAWGHLTWPVPPPWHLVKRDDLSKTHRAQAAAEFNLLLTLVTGDLRREIAIWRLACLANEPQMQSEASAICIEILTLLPSCVPALVWARERDIEFDKAVAIASLWKKVASNSAATDEIIILFAFLIDSQNMVEAEKLLDDQKAIFAQNHALSNWRLHKAQCHLMRNDSDSAFRLLDEEPEQDRKRDLRHALMDMISKRNQNYESLGMESETEFLKSGDPNCLFTSCLARRMEKKWKFIADHSQRLVELIGTDASLRLGVEAALNARRPELVLSLLENHGKLCPGGRLPPDLERARAEAFKQQGYLGKAVEAAEKAASAAPDLETLAHLFRLRRSKGDLLGSADAARHLIKLPELPTRFVTEEIIPTIRRVAPNLTQEFVRKAKASLPPDSPALLLVAQQASKIGMTQIAQEAFGKLSDWAQTGAHGIKALNASEMFDTLRGRAESYSKAYEQYRRGLIPIHILSTYFDFELARMLLLGSRSNSENRPPLDVVPLLTRHASLVAAHPPVLDCKQELYLDITSILILHELQLLEVVESTFSGITIPAHLTGWLQAEIDKLQPMQPESASAQHQINQLLAGGQIYEWEESPQYRCPEAAYAQQMGAAWCERLSIVKANNGLFVDIVPLTSNRPEMEFICLPVSDSLFVIGEQELVDIMESSGVISATQAVDGCRRLGFAFRSVASSKSSMRLHPGLVVHLEVGIAARLAIAEFLKPLAEIVKLFISHEESKQIRMASEKLHIDLLLAAEIERLLAHISTCFDKGIYRQHECAEPCVSHGRPDQLSEKNLCFQDTFDYAINGVGILCVDDRFFRGLHREKHAMIDMFDLAHHLWRVGKYNDDEYYDILIRCRRSHLRYAPIDEKEVLFHLKHAKVENGCVTETPSLKVLRRSIAASLMDAEWLQRPQTMPNGQLLVLESEFPVRIYLAISRSIIELWCDTAFAEDDRVARADWLLNSLYFDMGLIKNLFGHPGAEMTEMQGVGQSTGHLFAQAISIPGGRTGGARCNYFNWLFARLIEPNLSKDANFLQSVAHMLRYFVDLNVREL